MKCPGGFAEDAELRQNFGKTTPTHREDEAKLQNGYALGVWQTGSGAVKEKALQAPGPQAETWREQPADAGCV